VAELVDALDLGSSPERGEGSSPSLPTNIMQPFDYAGVTIRALYPDDSFHEITDLLHSAYARLANMGLRFWATHQTHDDTRSRCEDGTTLIGERDGRIVATLTFYAAHQTSGSPWLNRPDVASFGQFAVSPELQGLGIGSKLIETCEAMALKDGAKHIALDTSESAEHLIKYYEARGYRLVEHVRWESVNYRSVVMSKALLAGEIMSSSTE
jgi:GNAT superfamily N-acetyltransferase